LAERKPVLLHPDSFFLIIRHRCLNHINLNLEGLDFVLNYCSIITSISCLNSTTTLSRSKNYLEKLSECILCVNACRRNRQITLPD
jgi:hypothetical protein